MRQSDAYDDTLPSGPALQTGSTDLQYDLNALRSQVKRLTNGAHWYDDPVVGGELRRLLFFIDGGPVEGFAGAYREVTGVPWPSAVTWWVDSGKTRRIVEKLITRNSAQAPTSIAWRLYDTDGVTVIVTSTDTIVNTGTPPVFETSRTRVIS